MSAEPATRGRADPQATLSAWYRWAPLAVVAVTCALPLRGLWRAPGPPMEEGFMLVFPELVFEGLVPNRDFLHLYGPGSLWVLGAAYKVLGTSLAVERSIGFLQQLGVAFSVFALLRPWGRWVGAAGGAMAAVVLLPPAGLTALAWVGAIALGLWALHAGCSGRPALAGVLAGLALLYRLDLVVAIGLAGIVIVRALDRHDRRRLLAGFAAGLSPYVAHLAMAGPATALHGLVIEPVFDLRGGRRLPLPPSWSDYDGFLQRAGRLGELHWPLPSPPGPPQLGLWLALIVAAVAVLLVAGRAAARAGDHRLLAMAAFSAGVLPQALQRADSTHLAWVSCVAFGLLPAGVVELLRRHATSWPSSRRTAMAMLSAPVLALVLVPYFTWRDYGDGVAQTFGVHRQSHAIRHDGRLFYYGRADAVAAIDQLLVAIDGVAEPGDRLFVGTGDLRKTPYSEAFLYYLLPDLVPATRYIEMDPGVANADDSGLAEELASADLVVLSSVRDDWDEPNESRVIGSDEPNQILARDFCQQGSFGEGLFGRGLYVLYVRCSVPGTDAPNG